MGAKLHYFYDTNNVLMKKILLKDIFLFFSL